MAESARLNVSQKPRMSATPAARLVLMRIVSGGQTGVDRAALDVARELGIPHGGWCPKGRRAEDGPLPAHYALTETPSDGYIERTTWNVRDSDATLILTIGTPNGGTLQTQQDAQRLKKPCLVVDLSKPTDPLPMIRHWLSENKIKVLNVAGPRESKQVGIYKQTVTLLRQLCR